MLTCWNLLCQKLQRLLVVERISRQTQRVWEDTLRKQLGEGSRRRTGGSRKRSASRVIPTKSAKNQSVAKSHFYKHFSLIMSSNFRYQPFVAVSGNLGGKVPVNDNGLSSHEQEIHLTSSLDENCIEFEFQTDRNYYVDLRQTYLALKLKLVRGRGYETYNTKEVKEEHKEEAKAEEEETAEEEAPVPLVTHVNNLLHSFFPILKCTSTISKFTTLMDCMRANLTFPTTSREPSWNTREFSTARGTTKKNF